jgi:hypothetical protein
VRVGSSLSMVTVSHETCLCNAMHRRSVSTKSAQAIAYLLHECDTAVDPIVISWVGTSHLLSTDQAMKH